MRKSHFKVTADVEICIHRERRNIETNIKTEVHIQGYRDAI